MDNLKQEIMSFASKSGVDLIGFASKDRFDGLEAYKNPFTIFPEGNTVILLGRRITRGTLRGVEEGSNFGDYRSFGYSWLDDEFVAQSCYDLTIFIENFGWEAVPIFPNPVETHGIGVSVTEGREAPNVTPDFQYAAVACGLGEIGLNDEILTKKYGPRQRFQMIITDAVIKADPILTESICDLCGKCADICPLYAIDKENTKTVTICGKEMEIAEIDYDLCKKCKNGAVINRLYGAAKPDRLAALCNRTCVHHLEENSLVDNTFENTFRKRDPWAIDIYGKNPEMKK